ncbi:50S ribosomal protein L4 [Fibrobacterota bacterium]
MNAKVYTQDGKEKGTIELPEEIFGVEVNSSLMHLIVKSYLANQRQGTAKTKSRTEVSGGGRKPFRQKGTGRARAGSNTSPVWVRGGKAFGAAPRNYGGTIPKKMRRAALCSALSSRAKDEKVLVIDRMTIEEPKTKLVNTILKGLSILNKKNLLIIDDGDRNIFLSGRNIKDVQIKPVKEINAYDVLSNENIVFSAENLIEKVKEVVKK